MNLKNLKILSDGLLGLTEPELDFSRTTFNMLVFNSYNPNLKISCNTIACAAGHGPFFGLPILPTENYVKYVKRVFGLYTESTEGKFVFSSDWYSVDNTKEGAGLRIKYLLQEDFDSKAYFKQVDLEFKQQNLVDDEDLLGSLQEVVEMIQQRYNQQ